MANVSAKITLTEKNDSGPLFDLYWSTDYGATYTASIDGQNLYLPFVGSSAVATVDSAANVFKLTSKGVCINSNLSGSIGPTPTPTACYTGLTKYTNIGYGDESQACAGDNPTDIWTDDPIWTNSTQLYLDSNGCTLATSGNYSDGTNLIKWSGTGVILYKACSVVPTPGPTSTPTPTPTTPGPTPSPTPTPTASWISVGSHTIVKAATNQHKSVWLGSANMYQAQLLVTYLTGQSSPATSTPYSLSNTNYKIYDQTNTERGSWISVGGTAMYYFDGIQSVVLVSNITISGTYLNGSSSATDVWQYSKY